MESLSSAPFSPASSDSSASGASSAEVASPVVLWADADSPAPRLHGQAASCLQLAMQRPSQIPLMVASGAAAVPPRLASGPGVDAKDRALLLAATSSVFEADINVELGKLRPGMSEAEKDGIYRCATLLAITLTKQLPALDAMDVFNDLLPAILNASQCAAAGAIVETLVSQRKSDAHVPMLLFVLLKGAISMDSRFGALCCGGLAHATQSCPELLFEVVGLMKQAGLHVQSLAVLNLHTRQAMSSILQAGLPVKDQARAIQQLIAPRRRFASGLQLVFPVVSRLRDAGWTLDAIQNLFEPIRKEVGLDAFRSENVEDAYTAATPTTTSPEDPAPSTDSKDSVQARINVVVGEARDFLRERRSAFPEEPVKALATAADLTQRRLAGQPHYLYFHSVQALIFEWTKTRRASQDLEKQGWKPLVKVIVGDAQGNWATRASSLTALVASAHLLGPAREADCVREVAQQIGGDAFLLEAVCSNLETLARTELASALSRQAKRESKQ